MDSGQTRPRYALHTCEKNSRYSRFYQTETRTQVREPWRNNACLGETLQIHPDSLQGIKTWCLQKIVEWRNHSANDVDNSLPILSICNTLSFPGPFLLIQCHFQQPILQFWIYYGYHHVPEGRNRIHLGQQHGSNRLFRFRHIQFNSPPLFF